MRLRRALGPRYLAAGKSGGRLPIERVDQLTDRERAKIESMSHKQGSVAVLDEYWKHVGHFAIDGIFALPANEALDEWGSVVLPNTMCEAFSVAFVVERGEWKTPEEWFEVDPPPLVHMLTNSQ